VEIIVKTRLGLLTLAVAGFVLSASISQAATVTDNFQFFYTPLGGPTTTVASGSFSYDSSTLGFIDFGDLTAFSMVGGGNSYSLAEVTGANNVYSYLGYDPVNNAFAPALVSGPQGSTSLIFGTQIVGAGGQILGGFAFDPLPSQIDPSGGSNGGVPENDGQYVFYNNCDTADGCSFDPQTFTSFLISPASVSAVPEPSTWVMMLLGLFGLGIASYRQAKRASWNPVIGEAISIAN
jgi:hypothetical protein